MILLDRNKDVLSNNMKNNDVFTIRELNNAPFRNNTDLCYDISIIFILLFLQKHLY